VPDFETFSKVPAPTSLFLTTVPTSTMLMSIRSRSSGFSPSLVPALSRVQVSLSSLAPDSPLRICTPRSESPSGMSLGNPPTPTCLSPLCWRCTMIPRTGSLCGPGPM
jgi:hypothetical protein